MYSESRNCHHMIFQSLQVSFDIGHEEEWSMPPVTRFRLKVQQKWNRSHTPERNFPYFLLYYISDCVSDLDRYWTGFCDLSGRSWRKTAFTGFLTDCGVENISGFGAKKCKSSRIYQALLYCLIPSLSSIMRLLNICGNILRNFCWKGRRHEQNLVWINAKRYRGQRLSKVRHVSRFLQVLNWSRGVRWNL